MKKYILVLFCSFILCGCVPSTRLDADDAILNMIKDLQKENRKSGYCESRAMYYDDVKLPYSMWICVN